MTKLSDALQQVRRANLHGWLLCRRTDALFELEWRGAVQWVDGRGTSPGGYWAPRASSAVDENSFKTAPRPPLVET